MNDIFFITPDVWRGIGVETILPDYTIICASKDPIVSILKKQGAKVFCLEEEIGIDAKNFTNTSKLLQHEKVLSHIRKNAKGRPAILYFKPSLKLDMLIGEYDFTAIGNSSGVNEQFENKVTFYEGSKGLFGDILPESIIGKLSSLLYGQITATLGKVFVAQFGHGWAGNTTFVIQNKSDYVNLSEKFPYTTIKASRYIDGYTVLNNCCVYNDSVLIGPPAIQINGISELSRNPFSTCGRQWPIPDFLKKNEQKIYDISQKIGNYMKQSGFKGLFGLDFLIDRKTNEVYLSDVNARITASIPFYTKLEIGNGKTPLLLYHIASFLGVSNLPQYDSGKIMGAQLIFREKSTVEEISHRDTYGVYSVGKREKIRQDYYPEKLRDKEYIYLHKSFREASREFARLETKKRVLGENNTLEKWVRNLWSLSTSYG